MIVIKEVKSQNKRITAPLFSPLIQLLPDILRLKSKFGTTEKYFYIISVISYHIIFIVEI